MDLVIKEKVKALAAAYLAEITAVRRHIHAHPELSFQEYGTSKFVCEKLDEFNVPFKSGIVNTGIVAILEGKNPAKKTVALRADLDALPIHEQNNVAYKSTHPGIMHACGHDVHTASLLGVIKILSHLRDEFEGTVKFIFQPGEEKLPGGASLMIKEGVLENPKPANIIGQHVFPAMEAGKVGFRSGMYMASTDELYLTVKGKGGHAAMPQEYNNPIYIAAKIVLKLNEVFMKNQHSLPFQSPDNKPIPTVLAFGRFIADGVTNVIPGEVKIEGTFRTMDEQWRKRAHELMKQIATTIASEMRGSCEFTVENGYPFLVNDPEITAVAITAAREYLGAENVEELEMRMTAEDFAFYTHHVPACFYRLGTANASRGITSGVHTPTFDIDEKALETSMGLMAWITICQLK